MMNQKNKQYLILSGIVIVLTVLSIVGQINNYKSVELFKRAKTEATQKDCKNKTIAETDKTCNTENNDSLFVGCNGFF